MIRFVVLLIIIVSITSVFATKYAGEFTDLGVGVRAAGMGGAFTVFDSDLQTLWWNPSGLSGLSERPQIYLMHADMYAGLYKIDAGAIGKRLGETQWAVGFFRNATENLPFTDTTMFYDYGPDRIPGSGDPGEGNGTWDPGEQIRPEAIYYRTEGDYLFTLGAGRNYGEKLRLGVSLKHMQSYIGEYSAFGFGFDIGAQYKYRPNLVLGAAIRDVSGTYIRWSTGTWETKMPSVWWGARYDIPIDAVRGGLSLTGEFETRFENIDGIAEIGPVSLDPHFGVEFLLLKYVYLRTGIDRKDFSAGAGLRIAFFRVDYAFVTNDNLDNTHRIGVTLEIPKIERPEPVPEPEEPGIQKPPATGSDIFDDMIDGSFVTEVYFETGIAKLSDNSRNTLDELCDQIDKDTRLYIEGHTDIIKIKTPDFPDNNALSKARAQVVANYISEKCGIPLDNMSIEWFGQERPKFDAASPKSALNRRVEVYILSD